MTCPFEMIYDALFEMIFWNDILLHAYGVFRVLADWILTKFNRQKPGWKIVCQSFRYDWWLSFRNDGAKFWGVNVFLKRDFHTHILLSAKELSLWNDKWLSFRNEQFRNQPSFRYDRWLSFRNDRAKFWHPPVENPDDPTSRMTVIFKWGVKFGQQNSFRQEMTPIFSWRKSP